jgi:hypothetical protein
MHGTFAAASNIFPTSCGASCSAPVTSPSSQQFNKDHVILVGDHQAILDNGSALLQEAAVRSRNFSQAASSQRLSLPGGASCYETKRDNASLC